MLDVFFIKVVFYLSVLKLGAIITHNLLDLSIKFILCHLQEFIYHPLSRTFILQKEHQNETRIIINNNKTIFVTANINVGDRTEQFHM
jgi:hypothetical protein